MKSWWSNLPRKDREDLLILPIASFLTVAGLLAAWMFFLWYTDKFP